LLVAEDSEQIVANPDRPAMGTVLEGQLDRTRGATATVLVQNGTLHIGDSIVAGLACGRVRQMIDEDGNPMDGAGPSTPVLVLGLSDVPEAGEIFEVVSETCVARDIVAQREEAMAAQVPGPIRTFTLDDFASRIKAGKAKELNLIIKTDAQGCIDPIVSSLEQLGDDELKVNILQATPGSIGKSDVNLAIASQAIIIGFNVKPDPAARRLAESEGVDIRTYDIIYRVIDDVDQALKGLLEPTYVKVLVGEAEVRDTFHIPDLGTVAGCYIREGEARRNARARVIRDGSQLHDGPVSSLKRFSEDVREVRKGYECGVGLAGFDDFEVGDVIQFYEEREKQPE
jgi:translation initiation factor IF-2